MKQYSVVFSLSAEKDVYESFEWGRREWGEALANEWVRELKKSVEDLLEQFPLSQPIAPESNDLLFEIRQMIVGRYRVLYIVEGFEVQILHVRGSFVNEDENS